GALCGTRGGLSGLDRAAQTGLQWPRDDPMTPERLISRVDGPLLGLAFLVFGLILVIGTVISDPYNPGRDNLERFVGVIDHASMSEKRPRSCYVCTWTLDHFVYGLKSADGSTKSISLYQYLRLSAETLDQDLNVGKTLDVQLDRTSGEVYVIKTADGRT